MTNWQQGWLSLDSLENLLRVKRNGSSHWTQNLQVALQLCVAKQARRQVVYKTGISTERYTTLSHQRSWSTTNFTLDSEKPWESVATFVPKLRTAAQTCNFGDSLGDMLRDRLVCGISDDYIQCCLLSEPRLDFKKAMELAVGWETAVKNARELQSLEREFASTGRVNKLADSEDSEAAKPYYHHGKMSYLP